MNYKKIIIIPVVFLVICIAYLVWQLSTTGLNLSVDLKGGTQITAESSSDINEKNLEGVLSQYDASIRVARSATGYSVFIEFDTSIEPDDVMKTLEDSGYDFRDYSVQTIGSTLGAAFFEQALTALVFAFVFMSIASFIIFRKFVLGVRVVISAFADIVETLVISQILGIELSLATFAALLLLIGYSVDDDVLLTTRIIKGTGELNEKFKRARKTAFTMIGATCAALLALFLISVSSIITQIASIMLIGLLCDIINTWLLNASILRWYVEKGVK